MKYLFLVLNLIALHCAAQVTLKFDKRFGECEDKWVAFSMGKDSSHLYGFIYIDEDAGMTFRKEGDFKLNNGEIRLTKNEELNLMVRLEASNVRVAIIPESMYENLKIKNVPDWLKHYQADTWTAKRFYRWGFTYNGMNECEKALTFLKKARELDAKYKGLGVELAYSYNCLKSYAEAENVLDEEVKLDPSNAYVNKEYIYALVKNNKIEKAIEQYKASIKTLKDKIYHAENCFNIMQHFYQKKDKKNFNVWYKELSRWETDNQLISEYASKMKKSL